jgi:ferredoxin
MILDRSFYTKISTFKSWWYQRQMRRFSKEKVFKAFKLVKISLPNNIYFYSPRLKRVPKFSGDIEKLSRWQESKSCETICPTQAIKVMPGGIFIEPRGCISCGACIDFAPDGLLEMPTELNCFK